MSSAAELKVIFQDGWNIPARVDNYVRHVGEGEFGEGESLRAWRTCLESALMAAGRLNVLDAGTGPGIFACLYAQMGHRCTGLDFSQRMLAEARRRAGDLAVDCKFVFGDAEEPPFDRDTFDVVSSRHLLFNLPRPGVAVRQWVRVLKPGGKMILIGDEPHEAAAALSGRARRVLGGWTARLFGGRRPGWQPTADYLKAVSQCPLFRHGPGPVRAVMEAAGLEDIRTVATDGIFAARQKASSRSRRLHWAAGQPFILVGIKPSGP